jgi:uncharacterized protein YdeI (YjbR/CyaY-like superfamily)
LTTTGFDGNPFILLDNRIGEFFMAIPSQSIEFKNRDQWRGWLEKHHDTEGEAWLIIYKKKYQNLGLALDQAVEEALCFGWIDGTLRSMDEKRYTLRFSPRTGTSIWSISNIRRVEKLIAAGKMTAAGHAKIQEAKENGEWEAAIRREQVDVIPPELEEALSNAGALDAYRALPDSLKKRYLYWLQSAKRKDTKQNRVQKIVKILIEEKSNVP